MRHISKEVTEELIIEYRRKGYSISKISEKIDVPVARVMDVLSKLNEESEIDKESDRTSRVDFIELYSSLEMVTLCALRSTNI